MNVITESEGTPLPLLRLTTERSVCVCPCPSVPVLCVCFSSSVGERREKKVPAGKLVQPAFLSMPGPEGWRQL